VLNIVENGELPDCYLFVQGKMTDSRIKNSRMWIFSVCLAHRDHSVCKFHPLITVDGMRVCILLQNMRVTQSLVIQLGTMVGCDDIAT
jgi:hypothetical protein